MKLIIVEELPKRERRWHDLNSMLEEVDRTNGTIVKVDYTSGEWVNPSSCAASIRTAIRRSGRTFKVSCRNGGVYILK